MGKEQLCPFSPRSELIGIWNSLRHGTPPLPERLKGVVDNARSTIREIRNQSAHSSFEYQEGVDRKGRPDLVHSYFGSMTDSILRNVAIQKTPEGRRVAKAQLKQWLLIKEAALNLKDGEEIYVLIPKMIEIEDGVALMRLRKEGGRFPGESCLLPEGFNQDKANLLFEKFEERGLEIKTLDKNETSLLYWVAKGEKENSIDLKDDLPQILTEISGLALAQEAQESQIAQPLTEFSSLISFSLFELVLPRAGETRQSALEKPRLNIVRENVATSPQSKAEKLQVRQVELSLNQPDNLVRDKLHYLHNLQQSLKDVQHISIEENEEISVKEEQGVDMDQQEIAVETVNQPAIRKEAVTEVSIYVHPGGVNRKETESRVAVAVDRSSEELQLKESVEKKIVATEREEVVVFEAAKPATEFELVTSVTEPFVFIRKEPILPPVEEVILPILIVPSFERVEQIALVKEETSHGIIREMVEKEIVRQEEQKEVAETEGGLVLPKVEVWAPKIVPRFVAKTMERRRLNLPLSLFSPGRKNTVTEVSRGLHLRGVKNTFPEWREPGWIELVPPKEISLITALARDKFGINYHNSSAILADLTLFWLAAMSLLTQKPTLYKLELDLVPLTVNVKNGKILVARRVIPEEILTRENLWAEGRYFPSRPLLFLTV